jgi:hypothetical protein
MNIKRPRLAILILTVGVACLAATVCDGQNFAESFNSLWCICAVCSATLSFCVEKKKSNPN